ncbi:hypothetical protein SAMN02745165_00822 [Malonomonas rubra DSM 5091]|uniref:Uncharacterized protein n=1 Tax=Malonomonas rubra DSM 5091 TaxID=1122189 RepID=A0A1M6DVQ7_MALRU|nr:hypothetical protein [Malonomonas rubra]SHI77255.1 hypothetical protein SAMN02745165_00822 [Malonomonas rubra DSM 5091]
MPKQIFKFFLPFFFLFFLIFPLWAEENGSTQRADSQNLFLADCDKCHQKELTDIAEAGLGHKTDISCTDCHNGHRPKNFENIPKCSLCHQGSEHYQLQQCLICHNNPHRPREIVLPKKAHQECMSCHKTQGIELAENPSYHSDLVCTDCHVEHGQLPPCMSCHKGHNEQMTEEACSLCHQPHKPLAVSYAATTPSSDCSGCHPQAAKELSASGSKHSSLNCAACHPQQHKKILECSDCHGRLHADEILNRFPNCGGCHGSAHNLL